MEHPLRYLSCLACMIVFVDVIGFIIGGKYRTANPEKRWWATRIPWITASKWYATQYPSSSLPYLFWMGYVGVIVLIIFGIIQN